MSCGYPSPAALFLAEQVRKNGPRSGAVAFIQIDALPGAEAQFSVFQGHQQGRPEQAAADMGVRIAFGVAPAVGMRGDFIEEPDKVAPDVRVRAFVDGQPAGGMRAEQMESAVRAEMPPGKFAYGGCDVQHLFAARGAKFQSLHVRYFLLDLLTMIQVWISWFSSVQCRLYSMRGPVTGPMS